MKPIAPPQRHSEEDGRAGDDRRVAQPFGADDGEDEPAESHGDGAGNQIPHPDAVTHPPPLAERAQPVAPDARQIAPEIDEHREQRAHVNRHVEAETLIRPGDEQRQQDEMRRARDRQEFGEPLEDRQDDDLNPIH